MTELKLHPTARSHTALFRVLAGLVASIRPNSTDKITCPANRPGQNVWECYTLAGMIFIMLMGYFTILIGEFFGAALASYLLGFLVALGLTLIALQSAIVVFALVYHTLKAIQLLPLSAAKQAPVALHLFAATLFALALLWSGRTVLILISMPWLIGVALNFACALVLFFKNFITQIQGGEGEF